MDSRLVTTSVQNQLGNGAPPEVQIVTLLPEDEPRTDVVSNVSDDKTPISQDQTGVDNKLRAIFGKVVAQLTPYHEFHQEICFGFLKKASAAEETNNRTEYLNAISQIWDMIQDCRKNAQKRIKRRRTKRQNEVDSSADGQSGTVKSSFYETLNNFKERDLLWIVRYAQFGALISQVTKTGNVDACFLYLTNAKYADDCKSESDYERGLRGLRDRVQSYEQELAAFNK